MIKLGRFNKLVAARLTSVGMFLEDPADGDEVLLPNKYVPESLREGDPIAVFVYTDSEDRPVATTLTPKLQRGEFGSLRCVAVTGVGAFLDWGLEKDLLVPHREQPQPMDVGRHYVVYLYLDRNTDRLAASARINAFVEETFPDELHAGDEVELLIYERTDLGFNAVVNNRYRGLLYNNEVFRAVRPGDALRGYVKTIRDDNRIDLTLQKPGFDGIEADAQRVLDALEQGGGFLPLHDGSDPQAIYRTLEMSKKAFKRAIGTLYRARLIALEPTGIRLAK